MTTQAHSDHLFQAGGTMGALMREVDWSSTPLGPIDKWPQSLRTALSICLTSRFPMLIWWGDDLVMLYNDAYLPVLGASKHPGALGAGGYAVWPEIWDVIGPLLQGVLQGADATWAEDQLLLLDRNGYVEECYFTFSYSPIHKESGSVGGVFTAVTETTARVLGERRLGLLQRLAMETSHQSSTEVVCRTAMAIITDAPRDIPFTALYLVANGDARLAAATPSCGFSSGPAEGRGIDGTDQILRPWLGQITTGMREFTVPASIRTGFRPREDLGDIIHGVILALPSTRQDEPVGYLVAGINPQRAFDDEYRSFLQLVSGQIATAINGARAREEEHRQLEKLAELDRAKTTFFTNISHEFRTPLTLLLGPIEDVLSDSEHTLSESQRSQLEIVRRNALRLLRLVNALLDFAALEAGKLAPHYEATNLARYTTDLVSVFRSIIDNAGLELHIEVESTDSPIAIDRDMWEKIVFNLMSNAFKYTIDGEITVRFRQRTDQIELEVADTGVGIPELELPHIFDRFHRVPAAGGRSSEGTGIGLALVYEMVKAQNGETAVRSTQGEGSVFTVSLPAHTVASLTTDGPVIDPYQIRTQAAHYTEDAEHWSMATLTETREELWPTGVAEPLAVERGIVLVADDNADMREYLQRLLAPQYQVIVATNGVEALHLARSTRLGLIVSDVMMPRMDGFTLLRHLRAEPRTATLPVILLSARAGREAAIEGLDAGADDYLIKPFAAQELLARVNTHFRLAALRGKMVQQREDFITSAAHDLKTPLTSIRGNVQLLLRKLSRGVVSHDEISHDLDSVDRSTTRMIKVINEFLDVTRLESEGIVDLVLRSIDLLILARRAVSELASTGLHTVTIETAETQVLGMWDGDRVRRVVDNLLSNAIRYSPEGGIITVTLEREQRDDEEWAVLAVADTGVGIPEEELAHVFERFYRARTADEWSHGTGIGLTSARILVEQHGGSIDIESREHVGTRVRVSLPVRQSDQP